MMIFVDSHDIEVDFLNDVDRTVIKIDFIQ